MDKTNHFLVVKVMNSDEMRDDLTNHAEVELSERLNVYKTTLGDMYPYIAEQHLDLYDDVLKPVHKALTQIAGTMAYYDLNTLVLDCNVIEQGLAPVKEMTLEDIENKLGYKIKIVEKEN